MKSICRKTEVEDGYILNVQTLSFERRDLSETEAQELRDCEEVIRRGLVTFVEVGRALSVVRNKRLYRNVASNFQDYCHERWGIGKAHAYRLIGFADIVDELSPLGDTLNLRESHVRELKVLTKDQRAKVWAAISKRLKTEKLTSRIVHEVVQEFGFDGASEDVTGSKIKRVKNGRNGNSGHDEANIVNELDHAIDALSEGMPVTFVVTLLRKIKDELVNNE